MGALDQELSRISDQTDTLQFCSVLGKRKQGSVHSGGLLTPRVLTTTSLCTPGPDGGRVVPVVQLGRQLLEEAKQLTEYEVTAGDDTRECSVALAHGSVLDDTYRTAAVFGAPMDTDDKQYRHAQEHVPVTAEGLNMASSMLQ